MRHEAYGNIDQGTMDDVLNSARSLHSDESRFYSGGNAVVIDWNFNRAEMKPDLIHHYMTIAVIDNALLQYWQLHSLRAMVDSVHANPKSVLAIERELISGLTEIGRATLLHGTAEEISAEILQKLHFTEAYGRLTERLAILRQLTESNSSRSGDRRNVLVDRF